MEWNKVVRSWKRLNWTKMVKSIAEKVNQRTFKKAYVPRRSEVERL